MSVMIYVREIGSFFGSLHLFVMAAGYSVYLLIDIGLLY